MSGRERCEIDISPLGSSSTDAAVDDREIVMTLFYFLSVVVVHHHRRAVFLFNRLRPSRIKFPKTFFIYLKFLYNFKIPIKSSLSLSNHKERWFIAVIGERSDISRHHSVRVRRILE
jgi:hypothetical protein